MKESFNVVTLPVIFEEVVVQEQYCIVESVGYRL
jgi:hypothetical protein